MWALCLDLSRAQRGFGVRLQQEARCLHHEERENTMEAYIDFFCGYRTCRLTSPQRIGTAIVCIEVNDGMPSLIFVAVFFKWPVHGDIDVVGLSLGQFGNNSSKSTNHMRSHFFIKAFG